VSAEEEGTAFSCTAIAIEKWHTTRLITAHCALSISSPPACEVWLTGSERPCCYIIDASDFTRKLKGSEVFVPLTLRSFRLRFAPQFQLIQILCRYSTLSKPLKQVVTQRRREIDPSIFGIYSLGTSTLQMSCGAALVLCDVAPRHLLKPPAVRSAQRTCAFQPLSIPSPIR
jgi:hypothetical protein